MLTVDEKLRALLKAGMTQGMIAEKLDTSQANVSRWLSGSDPRGNMRDKINDLYHSMIEETPSSPGEGSVPLMGYIGAGAEIMPEFEQVPPEGLDQIVVPFPLPDDMIAFEVRGDSMLPVYKDRSIVICYREQKRPTTSFFGEDAAVRTSEGRRFIKTIMRGSANNGVNLMSFNAGLIENVHLEWVGEIFAVLPRSSLNKVAKMGGLQGQLHLRTG